MELIIVRHATAHEHDSSRWSDDEDRPLSPKGVKEAARIGKYLGKRFDAPGGLWSSKAVRAWRTAEIVSSNAGWRDPVARDEFRPDRPLTAAVEAIASSSHDPLVIVGHEPQLSRLIARFIGTTKDEAVKIAKGGVAHIRFELVPGGGKGTLQLLLAPKMLK